MIIERCLGDLGKLLQTGAITLTSREIAFDIACGLEHLHAERIIHRDVKPGNVLISSDGLGGPQTCKICDFGVSTQQGSDTSSVDVATTRTNAQGTDKYMAPEMRTGLFARASYDKKVDVYSFGIMVWVIWTGKNNPYHHWRGGNHKLADAIDGGERPEFPAAAKHVDCEYDNELKAAQSLAASCWLKEPGQRPDFGGILALDIFVGVNRHQPCATPGDRDSDSGGSIMN
jgi:serine/threonine protein kinase